MNYGLTSQGFLLKRLQDINLSIINFLKVGLGDIDSSAESVLGQFSGALSKPFADFWEQLQAVYLSRNPVTAEGTALDYASSLTGAFRLSATYTKGYIGLKGTAGTTVPSGTQVSDPNVINTFALDFDTVISNMSVMDIYITVEQEAAGSGIVYSCIILGSECGFTTATAMTILEISSRIVSNIVSTFGSTMVVEDLLNGSLRLSSSSTFAAMVTADILSWSTPAKITCTEVGAIALGTLELSNIVNPVSGLSSVLNYEEGVTGRNIESDNDFRIRRLSELMVSGASTVEAIRAKILQTVPDVVACVVFENDTDAAVGIMTPHSLRVVVAGGEDQAIADEVWLTKPAGVVTIGSVSKTVIGGDGLAHTILFDRPLARQAWITAVLTKVIPGVEPGETFPADGITQVQNKLKEYGDTLVLGQDLVYQKFFNPIYQVSGIAQVALYLCCSDYTVNIPDSTYANLTALFVYLNTITAVGSGKLIAVLGSGDTTDSALQTAKGSAVIANDVFAITNIVTPAVYFLGNLITGGAAYTQANWMIDPTEYTIFNTLHMNITAV